MIRPVNGHILIEPLKHETFVASDKVSYEEIGVVVGVSEKSVPSFEKLYTPNGEFVGSSPIEPPIKKGDKVYFDSWLAAKFPTKEEGKFLWLVKWEDVRAVETDDEIPK